MTVVVTGSRMDRLPASAAVVKAQRATGPLIWCLTDPLFADRRLSVLTDGEAQVELLNRAGVDAVALSPEWLSFGLPRLSQLLQKARFYVLSCNLLDTANQSLAHPFMSRRAGAAVVALTGVSLDSTDITRYLTGVKYSAPDYASRKSSALMRQRADYAGTVVTPCGSVPGWGMDFTVNAATTAGFSMKPSSDSLAIARYQVDFRGRQADRAAAVASGIAGAEPDTSVSLCLDSIMARVDSVAARPLPKPARPWTRERLKRRLADAVLAEGELDGLVLDSLFLPGFSEPRDVGAVLGLLRDARRPALLRLTASQVRVMDAAVTELAFRPGLTSSRLAGKKTYRLACTQAWLREHPDWARSGFDLLAKPLWTMAVEILESEQVR
jgi:hypothetical protein